MFNQYALIIFMIGALLAVVVGIIFMMRGGKKNQKYGTKLMVARVALQGLALGVVMLIFMAN